MEFQQVPPSHIDVAWRDGAHMLSKACAVSGGEVTADQLKLMLSRGERMLFAAVRDGRTVGWCVMRIDQLPNVRVLHICELYAPNAVTAEFFERVKVMAAQQGCSEVRCSAKPAQARLYRARLGFEPVYETLRVRVQS